MTAILQALVRAEVKNSLGSLSRSAGTANGTAVDLAQYEGTVLVVLDSAAPAAGGTLDVKVQESDDNSSWSDVAVASIVGGAFTQVTVGGGASVQSRYFDKTAVKRYVRAVGVGATAATVYGMNFITQKKSQS